MRASVQPLTRVLSYERSALVDHEGADVDELARERAVLDLCVLFIKVRHELGAVVPAVALCGEDESTCKRRLVDRKLIMSAEKIDRLSTLELLEIIRLQERLECRPKWRCSSECAVDVHCSMREAGTDRLVDVNDYVGDGVEYITS